jgi:putative glutamine amidotransferase
MKPRIAVSHNNPAKAEPYLEAVEAAGGDPVHVTAEKAAAEGIHMRDFDGLLLCGGVDVNPALYGQERRAETQPSNDARDRFEGDMLREALAADKPVLAVCRGIQFFNVAHGGTLHQHLGSAVHDGPHDVEPGPMHGVHMESGTRLAGAMGTGDFRVNSWHHQAIDRVGDGLAISAHSEDGLVEGLERTDKPFAVAVQWHPEEMAPSDPVQRKLFRAFIEAACAGRS